MDDTKTRNKEYRKQLLDSYITENRTKIENWTKLNTKDHHFENTAESKLLRNFHVTKWKLRTNDHEITSN